MCLKVLNSLFKLLIIDHSPPLTGYINYYMPFKKGFFHEENQNQKYVEVCAYTHTLISNNILERVLTNNSTHDGICFVSIINFFFLSESLLHAQREASVVCSKHAFIPCWRAVQYVARVLYYSASSLTFCCS